MGVGVAAPAQSRRVRPAGANERANPRATRPSPTPTPTATPAIEEADDFASVSTELVTVPVRVIDRKNRFVGGLAKEDFKVFEDGVEQEVAYFTNESQPFTVALVLDMSYSSTFKIADIQSAAIAFIDQLRPDDKVIVISFDEEVHMLAEATSDRARINRAIRSTRIATGTSLYDAVDMTMNGRLRSIKGRKAIVLFTDGVDTTSRRSHDLKNLQDAMELDALIYPIRYDTFADVQAMKNRTTVITFPGPQGSPVPGGIPVPASPNDKGTTAAEYAHAEEFLNRLADNTGGRIYLASTLGNLNGAFSKIASELREFYSIGYEPKGEAIPGKTRKIKVRTDRKDVAVRARDTYVVPKKKTLRSR
jgi:VWFA-related protein